MERKFQVLKFTSKSIKRRGIGQKIQRGEVFWNFGVKIEEQNFASLRSSGKKMFTHEVNDLTQIKHLPE